MRVVRSLLITLAVLCVLFVAVDRLAVTFAESEAEKRFKAVEGLTVDPEVSIKGFPFLTQVLGGELDTVHVSAEGMEAGNDKGSVRISRFSADLRGVRLVDDFQSAVAKSATGTAQITYADLNKVAPTGITAAYAGRDAATGSGKVKVTVRVPVLGLKHTVISRIDVKDGNTISLRAESVPGSGIPGFEQLVRQRIDFSEKLTDLPSGISLDRASAGPDGVSITVSGRDVPLPG